MHTRLAFAVAAHLETDIPGRRGARVGDAAFKKVLAHERSGASWKT